MPQVLIRIFRMRKTSEFVSDPVWLADAFSKPGATVRSVAEAARCNEKTVRRWMERYGVSTRPMSENASLRQSRREELPAETIEVIEGELLGDGSLSSSKRPTSGQLVSAAYAHNTSKRPYLEWLLTQLPGLDGKIYGPYSTHLGGTAWSLRTPRYAGLLPTYLRWYDETRPPRQRKVVPPDLRVTARMALHWYLGDGCLKVDRRTPGTKPVIQLSTDGFHLSEVERLTAQLRPFRARIGRFGKGHRIILASAPFLEWIGPCPVPDVYGYKWSPRDE